MTGQPGGLERLESEALRTDSYLEALLAAADRRAGDVPADPLVEPGVRDAARRLRDDVVRVHPSFRFEERLARRLAAAALRMRLAAAAGGEGGPAVVAFPGAFVDDPDSFAELAGPELAALVEPVVAHEATADGDVGRRRIAVSPTSRRPAAARRGRPHVRGHLDRGGGVRCLAPGPGGIARKRVRSVRPRPGPPARPAPEARLMPLNLPFRPRRETYPPDMWTQCPGCSEMLFNRHLEKSLRVCPSCGHHFRISAKARLEQLMDPGTFRERDEGLVARDRLGFVDSKPYPDRLAAAQLATGRRDAAAWGVGAIGGIRVSICVLDFAFIGGSMGSVVGEKVTRAAEGALAERVPLVIVSASGGARMQEGTLALMQLVKTVNGLERLRRAGIPFISVLADPTTGGVFASFAALGDVNIAEPNALIGFSGARVSAGTIAEELPPGFQRAEFLFSHGFVDRIVARAELRAELTTLLGLLSPAPVAETTSVRHG